MIRRQQENRIAKGKCWENRTKKLTEGNPETHNQFSGKSPIEAPIIQLYTWTYRYDGLNQNQGTKWGIYWDWTRCWTKVQKGSYRLQLRSFNLPHQSVCLLHIWRQLVSSRRRPVQKGFSDLLYSYCSFKKNDGEEELGT